MPTMDSTHLNNGNDGSPNRRESLKLIAGIFALATGLGVPLTALGETAAASVTIKFYQGKDDGGRLLNSAELPDNVAEYLASAAGARMQWKIYEKTAGELGSLQVPAQIVIKIQAQNRTR